jgi:deoxyribodipyrimidine photo-lyase
MTATLLSSSRFSAKRADALQRLSDFVPHAGAAYAARRNTDYGPDRPSGVSRLSPYLRYRVITEEETVGAVLARHSFEAAEKFLQEVLWRTYWKGWLEMRPDVWQRFQRSHHDLQINHRDGSLLQAAERGETGIEGFDDWAKELIQTGYLHNHARMWFASIWIFTLKLPWVLGAAFFLKQLLDADAASNTLSWRWVAGLQTPGKTYLATKDNIARFTEGRFAPQGLAQKAEALVEPPLATPQPLARQKSLNRDEPALLLLHPDDLHPDFLFPHIDTIKAICLVHDRSFFWGDKAYDFITAHHDDFKTRVEQIFQLPLINVLANDVEALIEIAKQKNIRQIVTPFAPQGLVSAWLHKSEPSLKAAGLSLFEVRRLWDETFWPHATKGFFPFKERIPALLQDLGYSPTQVRAVS